MRWGWVSAVPLSSRLSLELKRVMGRGWGVGVLPKMKFNINVTIFIKFVSRRDLQKTLSVVQLVWVRSHPPSPLYNNVVSIPYPLSFVDDERTAFTILIG